MEKITKKIEITASKEVMGRIERFFALLHFNSRFGHSGLFAMPLDGDGDDEVTINGLDKNLSYEVDLIGGVGYDVEVAFNNSYSGVDLDRNKESKWETGPPANLYKNNKIVKTISTKR